MAIARGLHPDDKVADYRARGWWTGDTLDGLFRQRVAERGDALAVVDPANREALTGSAPRRLTWSELDAEVSWLAARLLELGLRRGDVLGVQLPNTVELVEVYLAAWTLGVVVSPLPVQLREREVAGTARQAAPVAFVTTGRVGEHALAAEAAHALAGVESVRTVVAFGPDADTVADTLGAPEGVVVWNPAPASEQDRAAVEAHVEADPGDPNDAVTICWTSGTESEPKGVPRCHMDWLAVGVATTEAPRVTVEDVLLNPFPMVNMAGISGMFLPWLLSGCVLVQHHPFDLPTFLRQVATEHATYTCAPPALLWMLLGNPELLAALDTSSLTRIGSGSAPLQPAMVRGWQERGISVINFFGSNEGIGLLSSPEDFPDPDDRAQFFPRFGAPGVTWSTSAGEWMRTRLVDIVTGEEIAEPGRPGELRISGPTVFAGYLGGDHLPSPFDEQGWLRTGDLFEIAGERGQFLRYLDRARDQVIRGGMNIAPAEIEGLVAAHPAVADVAVIGDPDDALGERVAAVVVLREGQSLTLEELVAWLREQQVASFKLPERLEVRDALPRNPVGKVLKRMLRRPGAPDVREPVP